MSVTVDEAKYVLTAENKTKRAFDEMRASMSGVENAASSLKGALGPLFAAISVGAIAAMAKDFISSAAALDDFSEKTGSAVERLSELQQVAKIGGQDFGAVTDVLVKMSRVLAGQGTEDESKGVGAALKRIGLNADELRSKDPSVALKTIAVRLSEFEDSGGKAALVTALLGKNAATLLPYLKDLATETGISAKVTAEQAAAAENLEKALNRLSLESYNAKQAIALSLVPALNNAIEQFNEGKRAAGGFIQALLLFGTLNPFKSAGESLKGLREDLEGAQNAKGIALSSGALDTSGFDSKIAAIQKRIEFAKVLQRQEALALGGGDTAGERSRFFPPKASLADFKVPEKDKNESKAAQSPFEGLIKQLEAETTKVDGLSRQFQILDLIQRGHYGVVSEAQKEQARALAETIDRTKEQARVEKETVEAKIKFQIESDNANKKDKDALEELRKKYVELIDPLQKYRDQLDEIDKLVDKGILNPTQATEARFKVNEAMDAAAGIGKELEKVKDVSEEVFAKLTSGFEDALVNGEKFQDVLRGIAKDLLKIYVREQITNPATSFLKSSFKNFNFGSMFGSGSGGGAIPAEGDYNIGSVAGAAGGIGQLFQAVKGLFGFASGGEFTVGGSGGTDSQLVAFRASPNETVSIRTPDQQQQNAGGGVTIVQNMQFGSDVNRSTLALWAERTKADTIAAVANLTSRGGSYARAVRG